MTANGEKQFFGTGPTDKTFLRMLDSSRRQEFGQLTNRALLVCGSWLLIRMFTASVEWYFSGVFRFCFLVFAAMLAVWPMQFWRCAYLSFCH